jgi:elongation factor G
MDKIPVDAKRDITLIGHHGSGKTQMLMRCFITLS